jgi:tetratricopeptide (TPR) repeat protein
MISVMLRHVLLIAVLAAGSLAAGIAMVPGEREQWTMLVRDGRNEEAVKALEAQYRSGRRNADAVVHLYRLYMSFAKIEQATTVMREFAAEHPDNPEIVAMLARHYNEIADKPGAIATLERLFELAPSTQIAHELLANYRLQGAFASEDRLLRALLTSRMITANDAERLGLMLAARGDLYGAREALMRFDELANPERSIGRFVLFDVLVETGDTATALAKGAAWIQLWRKGSIHHTVAGEHPSARLIRRMISVDEAAARRLICEVQEGETPVASAGPSSTPSAEPTCVISIPMAESGPEGSGNASITQVEPRDEFGRRRRR